MQNITCTECKAPLTVSEPVAPGKKIRCPKCQAIFRAPESAAEAIAEAPAARMPSRAKTDDRDRDDYDDDRAARRRQRERESSGAGAGMVIGIIAASLLLIAAVGFGVWWAVRSWNEGAEAEMEAKQAALAAKGPLANGPNNQGGLFLPDHKGGNLNAPGIVGPAGGPRDGESAPEIEGEDLDGKKFKLSDYRGKVVLLDFWGHW